MTTIIDAKTALKQIYYSYFGDAVAQLLITFSVLVIFYAWASLSGFGKKGSTLMLIPVLIALHIAGFAPVWVVVLALFLLSFIIAKRFLEG